MMKQPDGIDIIIPIYNAYGDLQKCIASILSCTDLAAHRLLLVNDASSDERILPYIKGLESKNILVIENEANLGFSGSINHGITVSGDRDVILLNSDTIVTAGWVEKLIACAYSAAEIATVTPLSNNATLCSVPKFLKENTLPEGYTLEQYAKLIETVSLRLYPRQMASACISSGKCSEKSACLTGKPLKEAMAKKMIFAIAPSKLVIAMLCAMTLIFIILAQPRLSVKKRKNILKPTRKS